MDPSKPASIAVLVQRMVEQSKGRACRMAELRAAIAAGTYRVSAATIAEAVMKSMRG
jgi:anti-sigma28 factor (negative regulator of flagellin synthesis)